MQVRICRECGEEYRPDVEICADCQVPLPPVGDADWEPFHRPEDEAGFDDPPEGFVMVAQVPPTEARDLADTLQEAGIEFALRGVHLRPDDDARRALPTLLGVWVPEEEGGRALAALSPGGEAPAIPDGTCPACGTAVGAGATECPECGLGLGPGE